MSVIQSVPKNQAFQKNNKGTCGNGMSLKHASSWHHVSYKEHTFIFIIECIPVSSPIQLHRSFIFPMPLTSLFLEVLIAHRLPVLVKGLTTVMRESLFKHWWWWLLYSTNGNQMKQPNINNQIKWTIKWSNGYIIYNQMKQPNINFHWALLSPKKPQTHCCLRVRHPANHLVARNHKDCNRQRWWEWWWWCWWCSGGQTIKINVQCWNYNVTLIYSAVLPIYCKCGNLS